MPVRKYPRKIAHAHVWVAVFGNDFPEKVGRLIKRPSIRIIEHDVCVGVFLSQVVEEVMVVDLESLHWTAHIVGSYIDYYQVSLKLIKVPFRKLAIPVNPVECSVRGSDRGATSRKVDMLSIVHAGHYSSEGEIRSA